VKRDPKQCSRREFGRHAAALAGAVFIPQAFAASAATPRQTEGPFYPVGTQADTDADLTRVAGSRDVATGEVILVRGRVLDTAGKPVADARIVVWQANHHGRYDHPDDANPAPLDPNFQGRALLHTDADGGYGFRTIKPGAYPMGSAERSGMRCQHIHFRINGASAELTTQMYFEGDPLIEQDRQFARAPEATRHLLIAKPERDADSGLTTFRFDIVLA
jgi:protocatechuate 3,4-dioxygenase beta subunit